MGSETIWFVVLVCGGRLVNEDQVPEVSESRYSTA